MMTGLMESWITLGSVAINQVQNMSCKVVGVDRYGKELTDHVGHEETTVGVAALGSLLTSKFYKVFCLCKALRILPFS